VQTTWEGTTDKSDGLPRCLSLTHVRPFTVTILPAGPPRTLSFIDISLEPIVALILIWVDFRHLSAHFPCHSLILGVLASLNPSTPTAAYQLPIIATQHTSAILYARYRPRVTAWKTLQFGSELLTVLRRSNRVSTCTSRALVSSHARCAHACSTSTVRLSNHLLSSRIRQAVPETRR
jgi:hypothetical protein